MENKSKFNTIGGVKRCPENSTPNNNSQLKIPRIEENDDFVEAQEISIKKDENILFSPWVGSKAENRPLNRRVGEPPMPPIFNSNLPQNSKFIGQGSSGCGFFPPIKCKTPLPSNLVSKHIMSKLMTTLTC